MALYEDSQAQTTPQAADPNRRHPHTKLGAPSTTKLAHVKKKHTRGRRPPPPRPSVNAGIMVVFGPRSKNDDPSLPPNEVITSKFVLPLTPQSLEIQAQGNWTDGIYPIRGNEHALWGGTQLANVSFSARLEPPAFYTTQAKITKLSGRDVGDYPLTNIRTPDMTALDRVQTGTETYVVNADQVSSPIDVNKEYALEHRYYGTRIPGSLPPRSATDVVMEPGAIAPPGYTWHEPQDICAMLQAACEDGEIVRLIMGDQWGWNKMVSIRSFNWRWDDPDPDVIDFDITCRQHRPLYVTPGAPLNVSHKQSKGKSTPKSYSTKDGDTLHDVAGKVYGDPNSASRLWQLNRDKLRSLWVYRDAKVSGPTYFPAGESVGPKVAGKSGHQVGKQTQWGSFGFGPRTFLRQGVTLTLRGTTDALAAQVKSALVKT